MYRPSTDVPLVREHFAGLKLAHGAVCRQPRQLFAGRAAQGLVLRQPVDERGKIGCICAIHCCHLRSVFSEGKGPASLQVTRWKAASSSIIAARHGALRPLPKPPAISARTPAEAGRRVRTPARASIYLRCFHVPGGYNDPMPLNASIEKLPPSTAVVTLTGQMSLGTSLKVADSQIQGLITDGVSKLVIDLTAVDYMDSAGLGLIVYVFGSLREKNGSLRICGVAPRLHSLLQLTKTDTFLAIDQTRAESLAALEA